MSLPRHRPWPRFLLLIHAVLGLVAFTQLPAGGAGWKEPGSGIEWSPWSSWSSCSRTCGGGAATRVRRCSIRYPIAEPCARDQRQYRLCAAEDCPPGTVDFRQLQCSAYDGHPIPQTRGATFEWVPFYGAPSPCELSCLAKGLNFYYNFGRVLDGTECAAGSDGVCINGRCLTVGCGQILGSEEKEDACRVCGGRNNTCQRYRSVFTTPHLTPGPFGYNEVTTIPAGATYIKVTENSSNYLVLQNRNYSYIINGNWVINWPGTYAVAGTKVHYRRSADHGESLEAMGPTKEDLHLMVLFMEQNSGIDYEYWLPNDRYRRYHGDRSALREAQHADGARSFTHASKVQTSVVPVTHTPARVRRPPAHSRSDTAPHRHGWSQRNRLPPPPRPGMKSDCDLFHSWCPRQLRQVSKGSWQIKSHEAVLRERSRDPCEDY
uniref:ADAMTS-like protein 5 isoform X2 n=1 Tax=Pristiophorus japonicus TaxID=55135 RepID=UPI00398E7D77